ncbi:MAG TPA: phosphate ABC transporter substrate-binding protein [Candidatus Dormibacteraeota bacterium]|nr:phosphate ABC transporter substrate-binding protein [Candidatus Dormibacteraeota bacterium]
MRALSLLAAVLLATGACGGAGPASSPTLDPFAGNYTGQGGGGALPQMRELTKQFSAKHAGMTWTLEDVGSDASVGLVETGGTDIGFVSRDLKDDEKTKVEFLSLGASGTGIAVNASNPVSGLTKDQLAKIFTCQITDWKDVGGTPGKIRTFIREPISATRTVFESYVFGKTKPTYCKDVVEVQDLDQTVSSLRQFPGGIGMVTMSDTTYKDATIKLLAVDGVAANAQNLRDGTYKIRRPLWLMWQKDPSKLKPAIKAFVDFVKSPDGQKLLAAF